MANLNFVFLSDWRSRMEILSSHSSSLDRTWHPMVLNILEWPALYPFCVGANFSLWKTIWKGAFYCHIYELDLWKEKIASSHGGMYVG